MLWIEVAPDHLGASSLRRVALRYEKLAENYRKMLTLAAIKIWL